MTPGTLTSAHITSRIAAALLGGYLFTWGLATLAITLLMAGGMTYGEALTGVMLVAFLVYLVVLLWAFAARSIVRVWAVLLGGGALMTAAAWLVQRALLA